jgi:hypothetical protein
MKRPLLLLLILSVIVSASDTVPPASIHLELGKDTLAVAEPTTLEVEIVNLMERELLLDNLSMFQLDDSPYRFSFFLVTPNAEEWPYVGPRYKVEITYTPDTKLYLSLPVEKAIARVMPLWWTTFLPYEYQVALEKLPPGTYKLFATYLLPEQNGLDNVTIYSDTIEFVFLPLNEKHLPVLLEMDSLWNSFLTLSGSEIRPALERIRGSETPYSEGAHAKLIGGWVRGYDSFLVEKARFNKQYPESPYEILFLVDQASRALVSHRSLEADSLYRLLNGMSPTHSAVLKYHNRVRFLTAREARSAK